MAKARSTKDNEVSLFPFMSILVCVIGILMLMITAIVLGQIGKDKVNPEEMAQQAEFVNEYDNLQKSIRESTKMAASLQSQVDDTTQKKDQLAKAEAELARLQKRRKEAEGQAAARDETLARKQAEADRLKAEIKATEQEIHVVEASVKELEAELADRKKPPEEAQVIIQPSGTGANLRPTFVECAASSIVLFEEEKPTRVPRSKLSQSEDFIRVLDQVRSQGNATLIFLVRPDGITTYNTARNYARSHYVRNGKLAIASQGQIDLSRYKNLNP
ncbi:MAG: hypothetical protein ACC628_10740 [Pirellulaceae bacterium]